VRLERIVDELVLVAGERGATPAQVALAWLMSRPAVASLIVGARTEAQLAANLGAVGMVLTGDEMARLDAVSRPPLIYPYWHQAQFAKDSFTPADWAMHRDHDRAG
jgi:aryl-alcohol dehydrogenase-like predicted oxidoreductase